MREVDGLSHSLGKLNLLTIRDVEIVWLTVDDLSFILEESQVLVRDVDRIPPANPYKGFVLESKVVLCHLCSAVACDCGVTYFCQNGMSMSSSVCVLLVLMLRNVCSASFCKCEKECFFCHCLSVPVAFPA